MTQKTAACLSVLLLLAAISPADDKFDSPSVSRSVRLQFCKIALIDHVMLAADRTGILKSVEFKEGQVVVAGTQIALISDEVAIATLAVAQKKATNEVEVKFANVARISAKNELDRLNKANELYAEKSADGRKSVSQTEIDKAQLAFDKAELSIEQAQHELEVNKRDRDVKAAELKTYSVIAPFEGVLTQILKRRGEAVRQGDPVAEIINTDRVRVEGRVKLSDLHRIKLGAKVFVRLSIEDLDLPEEKEVFEGRISFIDIVSDPIAKTTRVFAEVQNRANILRAGLDAEMEIQVEVGAHTNTVRVSKSESQK